MVSTKKMSRLLVGTVQLVLVIRVIVISLKPYNNLIGGFKFADRILAFYFIPPNKI